MSLIGEKGETYSDANLVVEEALRVVYSKQNVSGSWSYVSANVSGYYNYMREFHRYATKSFRYVGMTHDAAKTCRNAMIKKFTRDVYASIWNGDSMGGSWTDSKMGEILMAEITLAHDEGDSWSVHVRVNEDDVRYRMANADTSVVLIFANEIHRTYGSNGEGEADETEYVASSSGTN